MAVFLLSLLFLEHSRWLSVKNPSANVEDTRDVGLIPGSGNSSGVGNGNPLQYSCLENFMDRGPWLEGEVVMVHGVT